VTGGLAALGAALALASPSAFVQGRQQAGGGFAEPGAVASPGLTAWAVLGLRAAGVRADAARAYLVVHEAELSAPTDVELAVAAESVLGGASPGLIARLHALERPSGAIGPTVNATIWGVFALRQAGEPVPPRTARYLLAHQARSGGWSWAVGGAPDSNDTAAAVEALRALGVRGRPISRALVFLRRFQRPGGGFELTRGRGADAQSTAWAIQAFRAAGAKPPPRALGYLASLRRPDGSYRYSGRYVTTPVWVTAQILASRHAFPLP
jgi:hypothetical protein